MTSPASILRRLPVSLLLLAVLSLAGSAQAPAGCTGNSTYGKLDFWLGTWRVYVGDTLVGTSRIAKALRGCAIIEEWRDARGSRGQSLFYVVPTLRRWKLVWVTETAQRIGGVKEKHLIAELPEGGVRFQGELRQLDGRVVLDRTTLVPRAGGEVHQLIEVSGDGGGSWRPTFDARYRRAPRARDLDAELDRLRAVNHAYRAAWLAGDSAAVLRLFAPDAVLLPHHGDPAIVGVDAIRAFWWPPSAPPTTITALDITTEGADVQGDFGTLWGRFHLAFSFETEGKRRSVSNAGTYLMVLRRQPDGEWRITHRMWDDPVAQQD
jgi:uncharacterized protein (TIGR02246 family)